VRYEVQNQDIAMSFYVPDMWEVFDFSTESIKKRLNRARNDAIDMLQSLGLTDRIENVDFAVKILENFREQSVNDAEKGKKLFGVSVNEGMDESGVFIFGSIIIEAIENNDASDFKIRLLLEEKLNKYKKSEPQSDIKIFYEQIESGENATIESGSRIASVGETSITCAFLDAYIIYAGRVYKVQCVSPIMKYKDELLEKFRVFVKCMSFGDDGVGDDGGDGDDGGSGVGDDGGDDGGSGEY
jgi:hypothetical protein